METKQVPLWKEPTKAQWASFFGAWSGWVLDAFDFTVFLLVMPHIAKEFNVQYVATAGAITLTLLARLAGGYFAGKAADRWGRRLPMLISIIWFALCDGAVALAPSFTVVLVLRTLFGFGMGAEWTCGTTLAMENWPARSRGIASGVLQGSWAIGYLLAAAVSAYVVPAYGWRALFVVAAVPALLVLPLRFIVPESEEWSKERAGHEKAREPSLSMLFAKHPGLLSRTLWGCGAMAIGFGAYYALTGLYPTMLKVSNGLDDRGVAGMVAIFNVGMMAGSIAMGVLAAKKGAIYGITVPAVIAILIMPLYAGQVEGMLSLGAFLGGVFGAGFCGVTPMLLTGLFPAAGRARLVGIVYHVGAFFAGFMPMATAALSKELHWTIGKALWITTTALLAALVALMFVAKATNQIAGTSTLDDGKDNSNNNDDRNSDPDSAAATAGGLTAEVAS